MIGPKLGGKLIFEISVKSVFIGGSCCLLQLDLHLASGFAHIGTAKHPMRG
jgi:hypothetical protein